MNREPTMPDEELLSAYLDGECTDGEVAWVEEQLRASAEMRAVLDDVRAAREAVRALPLRDAPPEFWARLPAPDPGSGDGAADADADPVTVGGGQAVDLAEQRRRRRPSRWVAAAAGIAAALVIGAVMFVPQQESVTPPVAAFTDAHAVRSSLQSDAVSALVPLAVQGGFGR